MFQDLKIKICKNTECLKVIWSDNDYVKAEGFDCKVCNYSCCYNCDEGVVYKVCKDCVKGKNIAQRECVKCQSFVDYEWDGKMYCQDCLFVALQN